MIRLNNNNNKAFSLIEVVIALFIAAAVLTPILILQGTIFRGVGHFSQVISRIFRAKSFLADRKIKAETKDDLPKKVEERITDPDASLTYEIKKVPKGSLKNIKNLYKETVTIEWESSFGKEREILVNFVYKPEQKKK